MNNQKKILFIQTQYITDYGPMKKAAGTYFPLGIGYLSSYVKKYGYDVSFIDLNVQNYNYSKIIDHITFYNPLAIGISFMTPQFIKAKELATFLKSNLPNIPIVLGGAHPSVLPLQTLQEISAADFVVFGEGEITTVELLENLIDNNNDFSNIFGLAFRNGNEIIVNKPREPINDLDSIPFPDRELINQKLYHHQSFLRYSSKTQTIYTSRGCYGKCVYCASGHKLKSKVRMRSINNIMEEIELLTKNYNVEYLLIKDDNFTINKNRVKEFCSIFKKKFPTLKWHCMCRVDTISLETLTLMKNSGLNDIFLGIESGNDDILKKAGKNITKNMIVNIVESANKLKIKTYGAFILGLPGDSDITIRQTIDFAKSLPLTLAGFSILIPYPGTQVYDEYYDYKNSSSMNYQNFIASSGIHYVNEYTGLKNLKPDALPQYISTAQKEFYLRPIQIGRMLKICNLSMFIGYSQGLISLLLKMFYIWKKRNITFLTKKIL